MWGAVSSILLRGSITITDNVLFSCERREREKVPSAISGRSSIAMIWHVRVDRERAWYCWMRVSPSVTIDGGNRELWAIKKSW